MTDIELFLERAGLKEYDEGALLVDQGGFNPRQDAYLYESIPAEAMADGTLLKRETLGMVFQRDFGNVRHSRFLIL